MLTAWRFANSRAKARDARRIGDVKQMQTALELFFNDKGRYPTSTTEWDTGVLFSTSTLGTTTYMQIIPQAANPPDGACSSSTNPLSIPPQPTVLLTPFLSVSAVPPAHYLPDLSV